MKSSLNKKEINTALILNGIEFSFKTFSVLFSHYYFSNLYAPEIFGLNMRLVAYFSLSLIFIDFGFQSALIVSNKLSRITDEIFNSVFWLQLVIALFVSALITPVFYWSFLGQNSHALVLIMIPLCLLSYPYYTVSSAREFIALNFRRVAFATSLAMFLAVIISIFVYNITHLKFGVFFGIIIIEPIRSLILFAHTRWIPNFKFSFTSLRKLHSALWISLTTYINLLTGQIDYFVISILLNNKQLAYYSTAFYLSGLLKNAMASISSKVVLPVYTKSSRAEAINLYHRMIHMNSIFVGLSLLILAVFAEDIVRIVYGADYISAVMPLRLLVVASVVQLLVSTNTNLLRAWGFVKREFFTQFLKILIVFVPGLFILTNSYGIRGTAIAVIINALISVVYANFNLVDKMHYDIRSYPKETFIIFLVIISVVLCGLQFGNWYILLSISLLSIGLLQKYKSSYAEN